MLKEILGFKAVSSGHPSYWPTDRTKTPNLLDFFVTKGISTNYTTCESSLELTSNHTPVLFTLITEIIVKTYEVHATQ